MAFLLTPTNLQIKQTAHDAAHMARVVANETSDDTIRQLALSVFSLALAIEGVADYLPGKPKPRKASTASQGHAGAATSFAKQKSTHERSADG